MTLYQETPCEICGNKPWQSVYAFRSPDMAHLLPNDDPKKLGDQCPGSGGSREEVTIDYEAAARLGVVWADLTEKQKVARIAYVKPIIDAALKSAGFTMTFASEKGA